jgi:sulfur-oxidizing protein SoxZ
MKVKAKMQADKVIVKLLAKHPMETGLRKDKATGELIPAHYIQELTCKHNDKLVFIADFGRSVSKDPYMAFSFSGGNSGDVLTLEWKDNMGDSKTVEEIIK